MPKAPTASRTRTRVGAPTVQPSRPFPPRANNPSRPSDQGTQQRPPALPSRGPEQHTQDEDPDLVHANCNTIFKKADQDRRNLTSQLRGVLESARKWNVEKVQLQAQVRKLVSELNESKHNTHDLEKRLDESALDSRNYVSREVHEMALRNLLSSVTKTVENRLSESHNAFMSTFLPDSDVAQGPWVEQSDQFGMLDHPVVPDITAPAFSTSNPPALPEFDDYVAMPDT